MTVVRGAPYDNGPFVRRVLALLEARGFDGAPRLVGVDEEGREEVTFVPGDVLRSAEGLTEAQLASHGRLLRRAHDALAGTGLAGGHEVVCHGDAGPHNVVFRGDDAVALIDWEEAAPGARVTDLADVAWCLLDPSWEHGPPDAPARRIAVFCRGYGWDDVGEVMRAVATQVTAARDRDALLGRTSPAEHFERLLGWLADHGERPASGRDTGARP